MQDRSHYLSIEKAMLVISDFAIDRNNTLTLCNLGTFSRCVQGVIKPENKCQLFTR